MVPKELLECNWERAKRLLFEMLKVLLVAMTVMAGVLTSNFMAQEGTAQLL